MTGTGAHTEPARMAEPGTRVKAPWGRRSAAITAREEYGAYVVLHCADPGGPAPQPGQFYMLSTAERWGEARASARSCPAPSASCGRAGASFSS